MLEDVEQGRRDYVEKDLREKLKKYEEEYYESHRMLEALQKDKDAWEQK